MTSSALGSSRRSGYDSVALDIPVQELIEKAKFPCCVVLSSDSAAQRLLPEEQRPVKCFKQEKMVLLGSCTTTVPVLRNEHYTFLQPPPELYSNSVHYSVVHDGQKCTGSVIQNLRTVLQQAAGRRPMYVRAVNSWTSKDHSTSNILQDDVFRVSTRTKESAGVTYVQWDRVRVPGDGISSVILQVLPTEFTLLPLVADCMFSMILDPRTYTMAELGRLHLAGKLALPVTVRSDVTPNGVTLSSGAELSLTTFTAIPWLYALHSPSDVADSPTVYRISATSTTTICASKPDHSAINQAMTFLLKRLGDQDTVDIDAGPEKPPIDRKGTGQSYVGACDEFPPPPMDLVAPADENEPAPPRLPLKLPPPADEDPGQDYDYSYTYTEAEHPVPSGEPTNEYMTMAPRPNLSSPSMMSPTSPRYSSMPGVSPIMSRPYRETVRRNDDEPVVSSRFTAANMKRSSSNDDPGRNQEPAGGRSRKVATLTRMGSPRTSRRRSECRSLSPSPRLPTKAGDEYLTLLGPAKTFALKAKFEDPTGTLLTQKLIQNGLGVYAEVFREKGIDWQRFRALTNEWLQRELQIDDASERIRIMELQCQ